MAFEADEVLRVLGVERGIDRMGGGGDQDVHRSGTDRASNAFNENAEFAIAGSDSLIDWKGKERRLHGDERVEARRGMRWMSRFPKSILQFCDADDTDCAFSFESKR